MNNTFLKRLFCAAGAILLCLSHFACAKDQPITTEEDETETGLLTKDRSPVSEEEYDYAEEEELLGKMETWLGYADSGKLSAPDSFTTTVIDDKKDLDPYRNFISGFTSEDEARILEDDGGKCILVELTGKTEYTLYGTSSVMKNGSSITVVVSTDEVEEAGALHTYFLLYFPSDIYDGEVIDITF